LVTMGMIPHLTGRWSKVNHEYLKSNRRASDAAGGFGAIAKVLRLTLQSAVLGVGAYLVILHEASAGIIIAGSILRARALAPLDSAIAHWRGWVTARQSWARMRSVLATMPAEMELMPLQAPHRSLAVDKASVAPPGAEKIVVHDLSLKLQRGNGLG